MAAAGVDPAEYPGLAVSRPPNMHLALLQQGLKQGQVQAKVWVLDLRTIGKLQ